MTKETAFIHPIQLQTGDIDALGHVNNVVYVRWVQEVAEAHWKKVATTEMAKNLVWVVLRHEIDYHSPALPDYVIEGSTRVGAYKGARFERFVYIHHAKTHQLLAEAKTIWCLLDTKTLKPTRIYPELAEKLLAGSLPVLK
jgi:acyl-CoA thioester hydrolase